MRTALMVKSVSFLLVLAALAGLSSTAVCGGPPAVEPQDVALREGGALVGQVVDPQGAVKAGAPVSLYDGKTPVGVSATDKQGMFVFQRVRGGVYRLASSDAQGVYRLWSPGTAPPKAKPGVMLVAGTETVRGQAAAAASLGSIAPYVAAGGVVATAVAVPVVISTTSDRPASP